MKAIEVLQDEHKIILQVLDAVDREAVEIQKTGRIHADRIDRMVDFFQNFADRCHHGKEEKYLFVKMEERLATSAVEPITAMLKDHEEGRFRIKSLVQALLKARTGDPVAVASVKDRLSSYVKMLRLHIEKEDTVLYPMTDQALSPEDQQALLESFEKVEAKLGKGFHEKYHKLALDLTGA